MKLWNRPLPKFNLRRFVSDSLYEWMLDHLPRRLMFYKKSIDSQHTMWFPRYGLTKGQIDAAKLEADRKYNQIKFK